MKQSCSIHCTGGRAVLFNICYNYAVGAGKGAGSREYNRLQKQSLKIQEENNLLKYKLEVLLDMLAASNADCIVMQKELDALKKTQTKR